MVDQEHQIYRVADIEIDKFQRRLKRGSQETHLRQKSFQVLLYLIENRRRVIAKDELVERIWDGCAVTDNSLEQCLAEIRKALGDSSRRPQFIKTIPRAGYHFFADVELVTAVGAPAKDAASGASEPAENSTTTARRFTSAPVLITAVVFLLAVSVLGAWYLRRRLASRPTLVSTTLGDDPTKRSIAVMFFDNESGNADLDWLREGLADMIITDLSRSKNVAVLSRQQLHVLRDRSGHNASDKISLDEALTVGRQTQARLLILGSFAKLGDQMRIDVHLHDARDGQLLTAERLVVSEPAQILTQVDLLSLKLATYIGAAAPAPTNLGGPSVMTNNLEAFRYYSLGVEKAQLLRSEEALALFQQAVALDQNFAMAYARIGYVYGVTGNSMDKAKPFLQKAFQFSAGLTDKDKLQIQAWYAIVNFDYAAAIDAFRRMISADPLEIEAYRRLALLLRGEEKFSESMDVLKQGLLIDAGSRELYNALGLAYSEMGRHDEAIAMFQRYVQLAPDEPNAHDSLGLGYEWAGRYEEAIREYQQALQLKPDFEIAMVHLGNVYFQQGRYRAAIEEYQRYILAAPSNTELLRGYNCVGYVELSTGQVERAEAMARHSLTRDKTANDLQYYIALAKGDFAKAAKLKDAIESRPGNDRGLRPSLRPFYYRRGLLALKTGAVNEALEDFKLAISHRPQTWNLDTWEDCLAKAYLDLGRLDEATAEYERVQKLNPNYPLLHYNLAQAYERKGRRDEARNEYQQFLNVWKDADADIPEVMAAKRALAL